MGKLGKYTAIACGVGALAVLSGFLAYKAVSVGDTPDTAALGYAAAAAPAAETPVTPVETADTEVISSDAKIIYRYHYLKDGHIESSTEEVPYFLVGLNRHELTERLAGWELVAFSPELAVFEKRLNARSIERYTVGIQDGYVAVFTDEEVNGSRLKEQTDIPVDALSAEELSRLSAGIRVIGDDDLAKVLEDYGS